VAHDECDETVSPLDLLDLQPAVRARCPGRPDKGVLRCAPTADGDEEKEAPNVSSKAHAALYSRPDGAVKDRVSVPGPLACFQRPGGIIRCLSMREADEEIREIKKEIIETRGLIIKTNNLANSLSADIKTIAKRQAGYERRFTWNGAVAYALFATLVFVGLKLALDAKVAGIEDERGVLRRQRDEAQTQLSASLRRAEERERALVRAAELYDLVRQNKRREALEGYDAVARLQLSPVEARVFRDAVDRFELDLSMEVYRTGLNALRTERYAEAAEAFEESIRLAAEAPHVAEVRLQLAEALRRLGRQAEAIVLLRSLLGREQSSELHDDATWLLSFCTEELGQVEEARQELRNLLRHWPRSPFADGARRRLSQLSLRAPRGGGPPPTPLP